jgi:hypothetical protein
MSTLSVWYDLRHGAEVVANKVKNKWLRIALKIIFYTLLFAFLAVGFLSTIIILFVLNYEPKNGNNAKRK